LTQISATVNENQNTLIIQRIIAFWGFNEAVLGGILHALRIPLTGLFIGSLAVLLISLLAHYSKDKSVILKATIIVIIVKAVFSPHTPIIAYSSVLLQGLMGYALFSRINYKPAASVMLGFFSLLFSALQKLIVTTIVFGTEFWKSIDLFADYIFSHLKIFSNTNSFSLSILLISLYTLIHLIAGITAGIYAIKIPGIIAGDRVKKLKFEYEASGNPDLITSDTAGIKRSWWNKPSRLFLFCFLIVVLLLTYFFPQAGENNAYEILIMIIRAAVIITLWFLVASSALRKYLRKILSKYQFKHSDEIERIASLFPAFRKVIYFCWNKSSSEGGLKRIRLFFAESILLMLVSDL